MHPLLSFGLGFSRFHCGGSQPAYLYGFDAAMPVPPRQPLSPHALIQDEIAQRLRLVEGPLIEYGAPALCAGGHPDDERSAVMMLALQVLRTLRADSDTDLSLSVTPGTLANTALLVFGCSDSVWTPHPAWPHSKAALYQCALTMFCDQMSSPTFYA